MSLKAAAAVGGECDAEAPVARDPLVMTLKNECAYCREYYKNANWMLRRESGDLLETGAKI